MVLDVVIVLASFGAVIKGADFFVKGAASVAIKLGMSAFVVGLTIVAIGTSAPELVVNVIAVLNGSTDLSIGNILGSNMINILLGLGLAAMFVPLRKWLENILNKKITVPHEFRFINAIGAANYVREKNTELDQSNMQPLSKMF